MIPVFWIGTFIMLFLAVSLILLVMFYQRNLHRYKLHESELLLKASLESERLERVRIANELHDGLQGDLNAIKNFVYILTKSHDQNDMVFVLKETKTAVEAAIETTRLLSQKLMPPLLEQEGCGVAIEKYFLNLEKATGVKFIFKSLDNDIKIPISKGYELYRIIQEFTTNAIKHGLINEFMVVIYGDTTQIIVELIDDGIKFDFFECYKLSQGSGLRNIQSRLKFIKGGLIQRSVLNGNHFEIRILNPLKND
ncbi:hypothetical protein EZL74_11140 [Flavobacterium silvisoli]|uniref:histidine kinase n=1 Tax=Flavobacterium silvisoli TaxID=2529433 RepID=A0A4Q9YRX8_9FLAO|nr:histidine kinase [Flavobacterium silvisoli]TBX66135.1 hypothetical protein EZL74_11140 [Flavobacterium silvisoli]